MWATVRRIKHFDSIDAECYTGSVTVNGFSVLVLGILNLSHPNPGRRKN